MNDQNQEPLFQEFRKLKDHLIESRDEKGVTLLESVAAHLYIVFKNLKDRLTNANTNNAS